VSARAAALADEFAQRSQEVIETIASYSQEQLRARCAGENCTVATLGCHVAAVHALASDWIRTAASGKPLPAVTMDMVDRENARQMERDADRSPDEVLAALRTEGAEAIRLVRNLSDAELDRSTHFALLGSEVTTEDLIRRILIGDVEGHLASIRRAVVATPMG
jgi:hypothetical protein